MKDKKFWSTQPVGIGEENKMIVETQSVDSCAIKLPSGFSWGEVRDPEEIQCFLNENYVSPGEDNWYMHYTLESIKKQLAFSLEFSNYSIGIFKNNRMVGYIYGRVHKILIDRVVENCLGVNFMCVSVNFRSQGLAPLLIQELRRRSNLDNIFKGFFVSGFDHGFSFTKATYFHLVLNYEKLHKHIYVPIIDSKIELSNIRETTTKGLKPSELKHAHQIYLDSQKDYEICETFSFEEFCFLVEPSENCNYTLYNRDTSEFATFYIISNVQQPDGLVIKKAFLSYWSGTYKIIYECAVYAKELGCDIFDCLNIANNEKLITSPLNFQIGSGVLYYHLYNLNTNTKLRDNVNVILL